MSFSLSSLAYSSHSFLPLSSHLSLFTTPPFLPLLFLPLLRIPSSSSSIPPSLLLDFPLRRRHRHRSHISIARDSLIPSAKQHLRAPLINGNSFWFLLTRPCSSPVSPVSILCFTLYPVLCFILPPTLSIAHRCDPRLVLSPRARFDLNSTYFLRHTLDSYFIYPCRRPSPPSFPSTRSAPYSSSDLSLARALHPRSLFGTSDLRLIAPPPTLS